MELQVRRGRADDVEAIRQFTTDTFSWGDYVSEYFLEWLEYPEIRVAVVVDDEDRPVAVGRFTMLSATEVWLASVRVDPAYRRQGVATLLNDHGVEWGRSQGAAVARLLIEEHNAPAQRQVEKIGYRIASHWRYGSLAVAASVDTAGFDRAGSSEAEAAMTSWSRSEVGVVSRGLYPADRWAWRKLVPADLARAADAGSLWYGPEGWAIASVDEEELEVLWIATEPEQVEGLIHSLQALATTLACPEIFIQVPAVGWLDEALASEGFDLHPATVYQKAID